MNSRERVLAAINHKQPDRVPVDLGSTGSSSISVAAYANLLKYLDRNDPIHVCDVVQQLARPATDLLENFGVDVYDAGVAVERTDDDFWLPIDLPYGVSAYIPDWFKPRRTDNGLEVVSDDGIVYAKMEGSATYFSQSYYPWENGWPEDLRTSYLENYLKTPFLGLLRHPFDMADMPGFWQEFRQKCIELRERSGKSLILTAGCSLLETGNYMRGMENFFADLYEETDTVERFLDMMTDMHLELLEKVCKYVGDVVDVIRFADDLGMLLSPLISPAQYAALFKPRLTKMCRYVHEHSSMHIFIHSCGSIEPMLPHLIDAGIEIINPVQISCVGMDAASLKKKYGKDLVFWGGGCDTREVLNTKSPAEVKEHVKRQVEILNKDGGFVFTQVHNIMPEVPPQNIIAMYEALKELW